MLCQVLRPLPRRIDTPLTNFYRLGVSGIAHVASVRSMDVTPDELIRTTVAGTLHCLQAAAKEPNVKRFVLTSSSAAVRSLEAYRGTNTVSADEYDEQTLALAKNIPATLPPMHKFMIAYFASKVASEQAFWEWTKNNKPHFSVNSVLPCTIYGSPLDVAHQGFPSTSKIPLQILDGDIDSIKHVQRCTFLTYCATQTTAKLWRSLLCPRAGRRSASCCRPDPPDHQRSTHFRICRPILYQRVL